MYFLKGQNKMQLFTVSSCSLQTNEADTHFGKTVKD